MDGDVRMTDASSAMAAPNPLMPQVPAMLMAMMPTPEQQLQAQRAKNEEEERKREAKKKYEIEREKLEHHMLSQFDEARAVRSSIGDRRTITMPVRALNAEFTCSVCLGIIRSCTIVMECLHRFCDGCIQKSLRLGKKECPQCRSSCPSRRNLRRDLQFDALISQVYPDLNAAEAQQDAIVEQTLRSQNIKAFAHNVEEMQRARRRSPSPQPKKKRRKRVNRQAGAAPAMPMMPMIPDEGIAFCLRPHPLVMVPGTGAPAPPLDKPFVRTSRLLKVAQLHKYLNMKLKVPPEVQFVITIRVEGKRPSKSKAADRDGKAASVSEGSYQDVVLSADISLHAIETTLWGGPGSASGSGLPVAEGAAGAVGQADKDDPNVMTLLYQCVPLAASAALAVANGLSLTG